MALKVFDVVLAAAIVALLYDAVVIAQSNDCTSVVVSLSPCLNFVTGQETTPSAQCCSQLATVVQSDPQCLCQVLNGGAASMGVNINRTQALALPGACNVQTPPVRECNGTGGPAAPPGTNSPGSGQNGSSSAAAAVRFPVPLVLSLLITTFSWKPRDGF